MNTHHRPSRISSYSKIALGSVATIGAAGAVDAAVIYFDVDPDQTILNGNSLSFGNINLVAETYSLNNSTAPSFTLSSDGGPGFSGNQIEVGAASGYYIYKFSSGDPISGALTFSSSPGAGGFWGPGDSGFIALRIDLGGGNYNYGWAQLSVPDPSTSVTITGFAFEGDANTAIEAGAIPEPSTYALLALAGLFGAAVWHHRRQKVGAPTELLQLAAGARGVEQLRSDRKS